VKDNPVEPIVSTKVILESLLFVADEPISTSRLAGVIELPLEEVEAALQEIENDYASCGFRLQRNKELVQIVSAPETAVYVERFLGLDLSARLSTAALEALGIVAYRQPVTRARIEAIRGVSCDGVIRTLLSHGLIEEVGRLDQAGRPILYGTTFEFLRYFGLTALEELPPLEGETTEPPIKEAVGTDNLAFFLRE
jgi:segregation and condensation protein B